ncbi:MAG: molybdopterin-synthase adenylyltransferase MoeB [Gemmatirosa sp.]|nr:molybdopterin-synthase adenylyltransferase MoeB [Gemmatirosa sp.]
MPSSDELRRYARQLALPGFGPDGQRRLGAASVLIVGAGGLGSPVALYLAAAGVGRLGLVDHDVVDASNLHRQLLYGEGDVGRPKLDAARDRLAEVNPHVRVETHPVRLDAANAGALVAAYDLVVDATDNFPARYAIGDACARAGRPLVHGSVSRFEGRVTLLVADGAPCYRCLFPEPPPPDTVPSCAEAGVLGVLPGLVGMLQATEAIKHLAGIGQTLAGRLLLVDALRAAFHTVTLRRDPHCPVCGRPTPEMQETPLVPAADDRNAPVDDAVPELAPAEVAAQLRGDDPPVLLDVREPWEYEIARIEGARLVPLNSLPAALSTLDPARAYVVHCHHGMRSLHAAYFLKERGLTRVANLRGGIAAWSDEVDPSVPQY